jgi:hypothetical protein
MQSNSNDFQFNKKAVLTGTYVKSILSQRGQGNHLGHYKIIVHNSLEVILLPPYCKDAVRPKEEVQKFEGKKVTVTGIVVESTALSKPSLDDQPLSVNVPCFITIESIHLAKQ